ncbi:hypothetical protein U14_03640 [Candidatus Moduliflexus flocculans]|uniref:Teneurin-like YD-shell domain-containing protein n=1 Tax=Candidatus Moduliflexus flocculans TaxID=1499966 RepID=A0A081BPS3_9BACT|nr:hypothetical protein U14_03640 [Candidatus Moduliflexus flocculans]
MRDTQPLGATPVGLRLTVADPALLPLTIYSVNPLLSGVLSLSKDEAGVDDAESDLPLLGGARGGSFAARASGELMTTKYYYVNGLRVAQARKAGSAAYGWTWIHSDHLGSSTVLADKDGNAVRRLAYKAFGEEIVNSGSGEKPPYTYTGKELDSTGLMYYGARYYDPALARFITPDTVYDQGTQGLNRYSYALNNPLKYTDPSGHTVESALELILQHRQDILSVAREHQIDPILIAGVVFAENRNDYNWIRGKDWSCPPRSGRDHEKS